MKLLLCSLMLFCYLVSFTQESHNDYIESGESYNFLTVPVIVDIESPEPYKLDSVCQEQTKNVHNNLEYYVRRANKAGVHHILLKIIDAKSQSCIWCTVIKVCYLETELEELRMTQERYASREIKIVNDTLDTQQATTYEILQAIAGHHKLRLVFRGDKPLCADPYRFKADIKDLHCALHLIQQVVNFSYSVKGNRLIVHT